MNGNRTHQYAVDTLNGLDMRSIADRVAARRRVAEARVAASSTQPVSPVAYLMGAVAEGLAEEKRDG